MAVHPGQQAGVAGRGGGELLRAEDTADLVDRGGGVGVLVGVDATEDLDRGVIGCHGGHRRPVVRDWGQGGTHQPGNADKTEMGPLARLL